MLILKNAALCGLIIGGLAVTGAGCTGTSSSGTDYTLKVDRELASHLAADLHTCHATALDVLENEFMYEILDDAVDAREGVIRARTARGKTVRVECYYRSEDVTKVDVFVGPFGDLRAQIDVFDALENRIGPF